MKMIDKNKHLTQKERKKLKKRIKKEKKMAKKNKGFVGKTWDSITHSFKYNITKPTDGIANDTLNIVLYKQSFLNDIAKECLPEAKASEFQTHYRAVQFILTSKNPEMKQRVVFTIPTVFFNFPQTVSSGSVKFDLRQVDQISNQMVDESRRIGQQVIEAFPTVYFQDLGFNVNAIETEVGSIHRHPGDFSFSQIDLDNDPTNPGVIYRQGNAVDLIQTDSVMYITGGEVNPHVKIVTTETRVVDVQTLPDPDDGIEGTYKKAKTITMILKDSDTQEFIYDFKAFFMENAEESSTKIDSLANYRVVVDDIQEKDYKEFIDKVAMVFDIINKRGYSPMDRNIPKNITQSHTHYAGYNRYNGYGYNSDKSSTTKTSGYTGYKNALETKPKNLNPDEVLEHLYGKEIPKVSEVTPEDLKTMFWNATGDLKAGTGIRFNLSNGYLLVFAPSYAMGTQFQVRKYENMPDGSPARMPSTLYLGKGLEPDKYFIESDDDDVADDVIDLKPEDDLAKIVLDQSELYEYNAAYMVSNLDAGLVDLDSAQIQDLMDIEDTFRTAFVKEYHSIATVPFIVEKFNDDGLVKVAQVMLPKYDRIHLVDELFGTVSLTITSIGNKSALVKLVKFSDDGVTIEESVEKTIILK